MRKYLIFSLMLFLVASLALAQQAVDEKRLAKAKEKGNVLFESVLTDANMVMATKKSLGVEIEMKYWTLKFENGAVLSIW